MISAMIRDGYGRSARIYLNPDNINYVRDNYDGETSVVFKDGKVVSLKDDAGAIAEQWAQMPYRKEKRNEGDIAG